MEDRCKAKAVGGDRDRGPTVYSQECGGHSTVLCLRPILGKYLGLSTFVVRNGHLCQSSRPAGIYTDALDREIEDTFKFKRVVNKPDGYDAWKLHARKVLNLSCFKCLSEEQKEVILATMVIGRYLKLSTGISMVAFVVALARQRFCV